jgi:hypothetical protein
MTLLKTDANQMAGQKARGKNLKTKQCLAASDLQNSSIEQIKEYKKRKIGRELSNN